MVEKFILEFAKLLASEPDKIKVEKQDISRDFTEITIYADSNDAGKLIGKEGKMIASLKTFISGCKAKDGISYRVAVKPIN